VTRAMWDRIGASRLLRNPERYLQTQLAKALHLGTYEAAIENMLRRMRNQADARSTFYLHRVQVDIAPGRINQGLRDENDEPAADIDVSDIDRDGLDAIRYLNAWEATGCVSLAVKPEAITTIQTIEAAPAGPYNLDPVIIGLVEPFSARLTSASSDGRVPLADYKVAAQVDDALAAHFLPDANPVVIDHFQDAVRDAVGHGTVDLHVRAAAFARYAVLMTRPHAVLAELSRAEPRSGPGR
jgi:hypothetical protein